MCCNFWNEAFLVKIANINVIPTYPGFSWYPYFGAHSRQANDAVASERSIFKKNHNYNI